MHALSRRTGWRVFASVAAGLAVISTTACGATSSAGGTGGSGGDTVKLGLLANLTGGAAQSFGVPFQHGVELALKEAKDELDAAGVNIKVVTEDAKSGVPTAVTGYNKLRSEGVPVILQDSQSPLGQAVAPLANDDKIAFLSGAGSELENKDGYAFRFTDLGTPTLAMGPYLASRGAKRVGVVVASDNPSFATLAGATEKGLPDGYASRQEVSSADTNFSAVIANLSKDHLDAVVLSVLPAQAGNLLLQMKEAGGFENVVKVGTVAISKETYTVAQDAANGFVFPQVWAPGAEGGKTFESSFKSEYGDTPTAYGALGYQVGWITVAAILQAHKDGKVDGTAIRDAIPAASTGDLLKQHGILDLALTSDGAAKSTGVVATFDNSGDIVTATATP